MNDLGRGTLELSDETGINKGTISLWRKGDQASYSYAKVARVAAALGTTAEDLLDLPSTMPAAEGGPAVEVGGDASQRELLLRIANLGPIIEGLAELEQVVAEARMLSQ